MEFKLRLKEIRTANGITHKEIATKLKTYEHCISEWERGIKKPNMDNIIALCRVLNISADYLLGLSEDDHEINY